MHGEIKDCKVEVYINGKEIPLVPFVNNILADSIKGIVSNLKGYEEGEILIKVLPCEK
jgi:molybdopterin-guanine dinucleotide biosynthesis protein B